LNQFFYDPDYDTFSATTNLIKTSLKKESHNLESKDKIKLTIAVKATLRYRQKLCKICKELNLAKVTQRNIESLLKDTCKTTKMTASYSGVSGASENTLPVKATVV
jgi:hypothetical protein